MGVRATVKNGRLLVDVATKLPDGTVLDLVLDDEGDELGDVERRALDSAITTSLDQLRSGTVSPADRVLSQLRDRRR